MTQPTDRRREGDRKRSRRGALTRDRVLAQALILLDRDGIEALTMRRLADELGVSPMALYNHVSDKQDLLQGIAQHLLDGAKFESDDLDWRDRIRTCFRELRNICLAHPDAVRLMETIDVAPLSIFGPMEITLAALAGVVKNEEDALRAYFLLTNFTLGQASYETRGPFPSLDLREAFRSRNLKGVGFPHIESLASLASWDFTQSFEFGLSVILGGLDVQSKQ